jgi:glutamate-ammonia-ligase adenylyltransferase
VIEVGRPRLEAASLVDDVIDSIDRASTPPLESLALIGEPDPAGAIAALRRLCGLPELLASRRRWLPALLLSGRPGASANAFWRLATRMRVHCGSPLDPVRMPSLPLMLGASEFLGSALIERPERTEELIGDPPASLSANRLELGADWPQIREARLRGLVRVVGRELMGCPLQECFAELSELADRCLDLALRHVCSERGLPLPAMLALGPLGAREPSLVPQIDLLFLAQPNDSGLGGVVDESRYEEMIDAFVAVLGSCDGGPSLYDVGVFPRSGRAPAARIHTPEEAILQGQREGAGGAGLALPMSLLRARHLTGPASLSRALLRQMGALVVGDASSVATDRGTDSETNSLAIRPDADDDLRSGAGGLCELERFVYRCSLAQCRGAGDSPTGNVLDGLSRLQQRGVLPTTTMRTLADAYTWLRRAEHFVQLAEGRPGHAFPSSEAAQNLLARQMGYRELEATCARRRMLADRAVVRADVRSLCADSAWIAPRAAVAPVCAP